MCLQSDGEISSNRKHFRMIRFWYMKNLEFSLFSRHFPSFLKSFRRKHAFFSEKTFTF